jgi:hypothetical protein
VKVLEEELGASQNFTARLNGFDAVVGVARVEPGELAGVLRQAYYAHIAVVVVLVGGDASNVLHRCAAARPWAVTAALLESGNISRSGVLASGLSSVLDVVAPIAEGTSVRAILDGAALAFVADRGRRCAMGHNDRQRSASIGPTNRYAVTLEVETCSPETLAVWEMWKSTAESRGLLRGLPSVRGASPKPVAQKLHHETPRSVPERRRTRRRAPVYTLPWCLRNADT